MAVALSYIFYFIAASASPLQRRWLATREDVSHKGQIDFAFKTMLIVALGSLVLPFFNRFVIRGNIIEISILAVLCGLFGAAYWICLYSAQKHVEAGVTNIVLNIYTPVTIILATIFLSESLTLIQILGTVLLLVGMIVVSKKHKIGRFKFDKYFTLVLVSGIFLGILLTAERSLMKITGFTAGTMFSWWSQAIFLAITAFLYKSRCSYPPKDIAITGILRFLQSLSWVILLVLIGNLSVVSSVTTFKVVFIFVAAAIFLNEKDDIGRKVFGSAVALVGLLFMG